MIVMWAILDLSLIPGPHSKPKWGSISMLAPSIDMPYSADCNGGIKQFLNCGPIPLAFYLHHQMNFKHCQSMCEAAVANCRTGAQDMPYKYY